MITDKKAVILLHGITSFSTVKGTSSESVPPQQHSHREWAASRKKDCARQKTTTLPRALGHAQSDSCCNIQIFLPWQSNVLHWWSPPSCSLPSQSLQYLRHEVILVGPRISTLYSRQPPHPRHLWNCDTHGRPRPESAVTLFTMSVLADVSAFTICPSRSSATCKTLGISLLCSSLQNQDLP